MQFIHASVVPAVRAWESPSVEKKMEHYKESEMVIYVGNFSGDVSEQDLLDKFEQYGLVVSVNIMRDEISSHVLGFGFVEMPEDAAAHKAIAALNRAKLGGVTLIVCETAPRIERRRFVQKQTTPRQARETTRV